MAEKTAQQRYRKNQRDKGLCASCPTPSVKRYCDYHAQKNREHTRKYHKSHPRARTRQPFYEKPWVRDLLARESFTAAEAGALSGTWGRDAVNRLRESSALKLIVLGKDRAAKHYRTALYKVRLRKHKEASDDAERAQSTERIVNE